MGDKTTSSSVGASCNKLKTFSDWDRVSKDIDRNLQEDLTREKEEEEEVRKLKTQVDAALQKDQWLKNLNEEAEQRGEKVVLLDDLEDSERLGPGGLDPVEVFDSLPPELQEAFEEQDKDKVSEGF